jgi:tetratricopeptide (TPR) repeat protein
MITHRILLTHRSLVLLTASFLAVLLTSVGCSSTGNTPAAKADALFKEGQTDEANRDTDRAVKRYQMAVNEDANHAPSLRALAGIYTQRMEYAEAIATWKQYVVATGGTADAYNDLGYCQDLAGWPVAAETSYREALAIDPAHRRAHVNLGLLLARHARGAEGLMELQCVLTPAQAHYNLALAYDQVGKRLAAQDEYSVAAWLDPSLSDATAHLEAFTGSATAAADTDSAAVEMPVE